MFEDLGFKYLGPIDGHDIEAMEKTSPLQNSFLFLHEWLWNWTNDVADSRRLNVFLHSKRSRTLSPSEFKFTIEALGFSNAMSDSGQNIVCKNHSGYKLNAQTGLSRMRYKKDGNPSDQWGFGVEKISILDNDQNLVFTGLLGRSHKSKDAGQTRVSYRAGTKERAELYGRFIDLSMFETLPSLVQTVYECDKNVFSSP
jgi:hypothetical protein